MPLLLLLLPLIRLWRQPLSGLSMPSMPSPNLRWGGSSSGLMGLVGLTASCPLRSHPGPLGRPAPCPGLSYEASPAQLCSSGCLPVPSPPAWPGSFCKDSIPGAGSAFGPASWYAGLGWLLQLLWLLRLLLRAIP